jgi:hypothetical protein
MFARFLELTVKPEKKPELMRKVKEEILPILKKYRDFLDVIPLEVEAEPTKFFAISLWHERSDAEKYERENFHTVNNILQPFLTAPITVKNCKVDETITKKLFGVAAA